MQIDLSGLSTESVNPATKRLDCLSAYDIARLINEEDQKVAVVPGDAFGKSGEGFVRCSYAYSIDKINEALNRIEHFVRKYI